MPASVELFTERSGRLVTIAPRDSVESISLLPLPRRPGSKYLTWSAGFLSTSGWPAIANGQNLSLSTPANRPPPVPQSRQGHDEQAAMKEARFLSLDVNSPVDVWFPYLDYPQPQTHAHWSGSSLVKILRRSLPISLL
ncbi:MAG: hypothetical protein R3C03_04765 [Pirellulaceae bacterium]